MSLLETSPSATRDRSSQTLLRGLDIIDAVREGPIGLTEIMSRLTLTRSTAHRLAAALVERRLLTHDGRSGYRLGPKLIHLAFQAREATSLIAVAQPVLMALSQDTEDATNLAVRDDDEIVYVAQAPGRRRVAVRHRVGDRNLVRATALGRALLLDAGDAEWNDHFPSEDRRQALATGLVLHLDDGGDRIRCIAAPVRDASGAISAALSLSSIPQYMTDARMAELGQEVVRAATDISKRLGWTGA
jgi:DNA-binding IclR family transcriptional regulator